MVHHPAWRWSASPSPGGRSATPTRTRPPRPSFRRSSSRRWRRHGRRHDNLAAGQQVFVASGCGGCHVLEAAGGAGDGGSEPRRDQARPRPRRHPVTNGLNAMPAFGVSALAGPDRGRGRVRLRIGREVSSRRCRSRSSAAASRSQAGGHVQRRLGDGPLVEWDFDPLVLLLLAALTVAYAVGWRRLRSCGAAASTPRSRGASRSLPGINTLVLALLSPLHHLGMDYLLSAHMVQHMMVGDIAPILLCLGVYGPMRFFVIPRPVLRWRRAPADAAAAAHPRAPAHRVHRLDPRDGGLVRPGRLRRGARQQALHYLMWLTHLHHRVAVWSHILAMVPHMRMSHAKRAGYAVGLLFAGMIVSEVPLPERPAVPASTWTSPTACSTSRPRPTRSARRCS